MKKIHILGICGTFMGGIALMARDLGYQVSGSDEFVYPPMSDQLASSGIETFDGYAAQPISDDVDLVVIGNALSRGNTAVEHVLDRGLIYVSGPEFLANYLLKDRWVIAVSGTHGKTSTASMVAHILDQTGFNPGFLIGGVPFDFNVSARIGSAPYFVVEADEYDTAFFDKRSKFVHYHPRTLIINNIEFDHADIFQNLDDIKRQFHHLIRTVPGQGKIIIPEQDKVIQSVLKQGCWTPSSSFVLEGDEKQQGLWQAKDIKADGSEFSVFEGEEKLGEVSWSLLGLHNVSNGLAAIIAAQHAGILASEAIKALSSHQGVKRRLELRAEINDTRIFDDFAHHPTAIKTTLQGLRQSVGNKKIIAIFEPRSNTMKMGVHNDQLANAFDLANEVLVLRSQDLSFHLASFFEETKTKFFENVEAIVAYVTQNIKAGDQVVVMSNGGFGGLIDRIIMRLSHE